MRISPVTLAQTLAAGAVLVRLSRGRHRHPPLRAAVSPSAARISVLVPARDEEQRLAPCLAALRDDARVGEVIVVDDCSTDGTAALARSLGARVLPGREPPAGWVGKSWALQQGLEAATGDVVVCLDADTRPRPGLLGALTEALDEADFVSAGPRFDCRTHGERLLHPSLLASLVYRFGPGDSRDRPPSAERLVANGQCMAARREPLLAAGGFSHAAGHFTDDAALARALARRGWRVAFRDGAALLEVRMHASARELTSAKPIVRLARRSPRPLDWLLIAVRWLLLAGMRDSCAERGAAYWLSPLADPVTAARLTASALRQPRGWRGRRYESVGPAAP